MRNAVRCEAMPGHGRLQIYDIEIGRPIPLPLLRQRVPAGFPSQAEDFVEAQIYLQQLLIQNRAATFLVRVAEDSMVEKALQDGDLTVVDRRLDPENGDVVMVDVDGDRSFKVWTRFRGQVNLASAKPMQAIRALLADIATPAHEHITMARLGFSRGFVVGRRLRRRSRRS